MFLSQLQQQRQHGLVGLVLLLFTVGCLCFATQAQRVPVEKPESHPPSSDPAKDPPQTDPTPLSPQQHPNTDRGIRPLVTVRLWPRSQWDQHQSFQPARVIVTRAIRICQAMSDDGDTCAEERDAWSTAVCRDESWDGFMSMAKRRHRLAVPHLYELYHTYDNRTYEEVPIHGNDGNVVYQGTTDDAGVSPYSSTSTSSGLYNQYDRLEFEDYELLAVARQYALARPGKVVVRWDYGHYWEIPSAFWNVGERALHSGENVYTEFVDPDTWPHGTSDDDNNSNDDRPLYFPAHLDQSRRRSVDQPELEPVDFQDNEMRIEIDGNQETSEEAET